MEEENEEGMAEDHDHNTAVAAHQRVEEMMEGAVERVVLDTVAAAWVSPPANGIKQYSFRGVSNCCNRDEQGLITLRKYSVTKCEIKAVLVQLDKSTELAKAGDAMMNEASKEN